uniref:Domain of unknown function DB domain-containing protein n=1 Tax=Romanomermis culicivorax TaxID=13658 RepID=A0A915KID0_ROMCU
MTVNSWLACANGGDRGGNNTECCQSHGVLNGVGKMCRSFCEQYPTVKPDKGALVCGLRIKSILKCHHAGLKPKPKDGQIFDSNKDERSLEKI